MRPRLIGTREASDTQNEVSGPSASVRATVNYVTPTEARPYAHVGPPPPGLPSRRETLDPVDVTIHDGRPLADRFSLDEEGFVLLRRRTAATDLRDPEQLASVYYPEIGRLVQAQTGARKVVVFGHTLRSASLSTPGVKGRGAPVRHVHNDYSARSGGWLLDDHLEPAEAEVCRGRRFVEINVWRPLAGPVEQAPLALCDARTVAADDLVVADLIYPDRVSETYSVRRNPAHRWFYFPNMRQDEVLLFKCFDSDEGAPARFTPHTAFDDPATPEAARPRESIEARALVLY